MKLPIQCLRTPTSRRLATRRTRGKPIPKIPQRILLLACSLAISGCVPVERWERPNIDGTVVVDDEPVAGVTVSLVEEREVGGRWVFDDCDTSRITARSANDGVFRIDGVKTDGWMVLLPVPADGQFGFRLCLSHNDYRSMYWDYSHIGQSFPKSVEFRCDIGSAATCDVVKEE